MKIKHMKTQKTLDINECDDEKITCNFSVEIDLVFSFFIKAFFLRCFTISSFSSLTFSLNLFFATDFVVVVVVVRCDHRN